MTVGKRIQMYRKQLGMSQEELGQRLLVSRQTISLWEKDQTTPTIDNLLRLKEVFGVSVDDILNTDDKEESEEILQNQVIRCNLSKEEVKEFQRGYGKTALRKQRILVILSFVSSVICLFISGSLGVKFAFAFFFLIAAFSRLKVIRTFKKTLKGSMERIAQTTYEYKIFEEYFELNIYYNDEKIRQSKCYYTEIEKVMQFGKWLTLQYGGQFFVLRKADLTEDSPLYARTYKKPEQEEEDRRPEKMKMVSILLFSLSIFAVATAFVLLFIVVSGGGKPWVVFLPALIPLASAIFATVTKARGHRNKKNAIIGFIMLPLICWFGLFSVLLVNQTDHSDAPIVRVEQVMEIDLPEHKSISTQDWTKGTQNAPQGYFYYYMSDVHFAQKDVSDFERGLPWNDKWLSSVPNDLIGTTNSVYEVTLFDYVLIYNVDTGEYNTIPQNSGSYRFINLLYNTKDNRMMIVEYQLDYTK